MDLPPMHAAARGGDLRRIQELAGAGGDVNASFNGHSPTDIANANGHFEIMKWIQEHGGGGHSSSTVDYTFSFAAEDFQHVAMLRHLLESHGKRVHMMNENRKGPWQQDWETAATQAGTGVVVFKTTSYTAKLEEHGSGKGGGRGGGQGGGQGSGNGGGRVGNPCAHEWEFIHANKLNATVFQGDFGREIPGAMFLIDDIPKRQFGPLSR